MSPGEARARLAQVAARIADTYGGSFVDQHDDRSAAAAALRQLMLRELNIVLNTPDGPVEALYASLSLAGAAAAHAATVADVVAELSAEAGETVHQVLNELVTALEAAADAARTRSSPRDGGRR